MHMPSSYTEVDAPISRWSVKHMVSLRLSNTMLNKITLDAKKAKSVRSSNYQTTHVTKNFDIS